MKLKEFGGYIELDTYRGNMLYENAIKLNCGRNALLYLIKAGNIKKLYFPRFMCDSCDKVISDSGVSVRYYSVGTDFYPITEERDSDEWLYVVNYYGQLSEEYLRTLGEKVIVDNSQAYFQPPIPGMDTIYSCRKFFGVPDGAILFTDFLWEKSFERDESFGRMNYLLGRYERPASEFYSEYSENNRFFADEPIKRMSRLTENLLHGIDYDFVKKRRTENYSVLDEKLAPLNKLHTTVPQGAYMYPFLTDDGDRIRKILQKKKIYIPTLWPSVLNKCSKGENEYNMALNILPLPVDQRYTAEDMYFIVSEVLKCIN